MYTVIGPVKSRTFRVLWMFEELGLDYRHVPALPQTAGVTRFNPAGKVPVLVEDGTPITDSTAIIQYLADKHRALTYPAGTLDRARQDSMTQFILDEFDAALWMAARHSFVLPEEMRHAAIKNSLRWEFERSQKTLARRMGEGPFVLGERMTVPDIILTHCGNWALAARFPIVDHQFSDYLERMRQRPAFRRAAARAAEADQGEA
ncbi:glutathione S-transferase family protein [Albidovulum sp.]